MGWKNELFPHLPDDPNPRVFLDLAVGPTPVGRVVIILKADKAPKTCENFRCLCTGEKGVDSKGRKLHFKGSSFHRVVPDFLLQGGDVVHPDALDPMNGAGQTSIYQSEENPDGFFDCEYNSLRHAGPGVISMAHCFGETPSEEDAVDDAARALGANTSRLVDNEDVFDPHTGIPRMSAIPVALERRD